MKKNVKRKKGFTLIELIIVISIIAVLAAIAVPKYTSIQKDAKIKADVASAKVIADAAATAYAQEKITTLPVVMAAVSNDAGTPGADLGSIPIVQGQYDGITSPKFCVGVTSEGVVTVDIKGTGSTETPLPVYPQPIP